MGCWPKRSWLRQRHRWRCRWPLCCRAGLLAPEWSTAELRLPDCSGPSRRSGAQGGGTAVRVYESMDFAREAALGMAHAAICLAPFLLVRPCWGTRTQVEWIIVISPSKAAETAASSRSHTPGLRQRTNQLQQIVEGPYLRPRRASPEMPTNAVQYPPVINAGNAVWLLR
jgi:hypothetical protein